MITIIATFVVPCQALHSWNLGEARHLPEQLSFCNYLTVVQSAVLTDNPHFPSIILACLASFIRCCSSRISFCALTFTL